jgi:glycosyltransferase involved in cell wall biosynthesis
MPRFSIVVPAYNAELTLAQTLDAILAQTCDDWECIVVDDGSTDGTRVVALAYVHRDQRFRVVSQENKGTGGAYNAGASAARGDFVVMCSADDVLLPQHLATMSDFIAQEEGYDIFSSNGFYWDPGGLRQLVYGKGQREEIHSLSLADVVRLCFYSVGAAYRRELFGHVGGYREDVFGEDYDFWLRAMAKGARHRYLPRPLSLHRLAATQKSADLERSYRSDIRLVTDLRRDFALSPEEIEAVEDCVRERERLILRLHETKAQQPGNARVTVRKAASRALGEANVRRIIDSLRALADRRS